MNSGELREVVTILSPVKVTDKYGSVKVNYIPSDVVRMKIGSQSGVKENDRHEIVQSYNVTFSCYYWLRDSITEEHQLEWNDTRYRITGLFPNVRRNEIVIQTEKVNE